MMLFAVIYVAIGLIWAAYCFLAEIGFPDCWAQVWADLFVALVMVLSWPFMVTIFVWARIPRKRR
jgi:hypothetical protein